jgi:uncharacterized protein YecE (DUF72 family)
MKNKTKQHRLSAEAQEVVKHWASLTGWSESGTASWFIINTSKVMGDARNSALAKEELDAQVRVASVEKLAAKKLATAELGLRDIQTKRAGARRAK